LFDLVDDMTGGRAVNGEVDMAQESIEPQTHNVDDRDATVSQSGIFVPTDYAKMSFDEFMKEAASRLQYQMDLAQSLLRGLTIGNGGAILALLTFIGNTDAGVDQSTIWWAFAFYGIGLVGVFIGYMGGFFSQQYYYLATVHEAWNAQALSFGKISNFDVLTPHRIGNKALGVAIAFAVISLVSFMIASCFALAAIV